MTPQIRSRVIYLTVTYIILALLSHSSLTQKSSFIGRFSYDILAFPSRRLLWGPPWSYKVRYVER